MAAETDGAKLARIRNDLDLNIVDFGVALGYRGNDNTISVLLRQYEGDRKPVPPMLIRLAEMFQRYGVPEEYFIDDRPCAEEGA